MLTFFRRIRKSLLGSGQAQKYVLYAVGEIALVVIGILIALQINNWNEARKLRTQELIYLKNLQVDLLEDKASLEIIIARRNDKASSADTMLSYHNGEPVQNLKSYYFHFINTLAWESHHPKNVTFEELLNSGKLSMISNSDLKGLLLGILTTYNEMFAVRAHMYHDYTDYQYRNYAGIIDYEPALILWADPSIEIKLSEEDVNEALQNRAIKNGYVMARYNNNLLSTLSGEILSKVIKALSLIDLEIKDELDESE